MKGNQDSFDMETHNFYFEFEANSCYIASEVS